MEKQRGLSEIIRKRNSKCKVEDYKRSIQKSSAVDEEEAGAAAVVVANSPDLTPKYFDIPINQQNTNDQRTQMSIERLNLLLSKDEQRPEENSKIIDKRNLLETIIKDTPITKKYAHGDQRSKTESILQTDDKEAYDDEVSKLTFREKMTLFNKNKSIGLTPTSSLKNRNRLTQVRAFFSLSQKETNSDTSLADYSGRSSSCC